MCVLGRGCLLAVGLVLAASCSPATSGPSLDPLALASDTSDFQRPMLADGQVTAAEYERAVQATVSCARDAGLDVDDPVASSQNPRLLEWTYGVEIPNASGMSQEQLDQINRDYEKQYNDCQRRYSIDVERVYADSLLLSDEERQALLPEFASCLRSAGIELKGSDTVEQIMGSIDQSAQEAAAPCLEKYAAVLRLPEPDAS